MLYSVFERTAKKYPDSEALAVIKKGKRDSITYRQLLSKTDLLSRALQTEIGLKKGDKCVLLAETSIFWVEIALAITRIGALLIPLDPSLSKKSIKEILKQSEPNIILVEDGLVRKIDKIFNKKVYRLSPFKQFLSFSLPEFRIVEIDENDPLVVPYTSGTTGEPKGAILTHRGFLEVSCPQAIKRYRFTPEDIVLTIGPFHHVMGFLVFITVVVVAGAKVIYTTDYRNIAKIFAQEEATILVAPPKLYATMYRRISENIQGKGKIAQLLFKFFPRIVGKKIKEQLGWQNLRFMLSGSAPISPNLIKGFRRLGFGFVNAYGMSENASLTNGSLPFDKKPGSVGSPIAGVKETIVKALRFENGGKEKIVSVFDREKELEAREEFSIEHRDNLFFTSIFKS